MGHDLDLSLASLANLHDIPKVADAPIDLYLIVEEFFKLADIEDLV